ncbi:hypothetical protein GWI33_019004 [Rhynchophorus ferrugineus]|uniref:Uncharacterized protein n=1 Tax=Rhynchophorus ferrugineus TaxID=354439 RepID=A0A834HWT3_RHYFE|nr:hypothetical protein GWI33_019004 [Rhynchophorus ferrugineus]
MFIIHRGQSPHTRALQFRCKREKLASTYSHTHRIISASIPDRLAEISVVFHAATERIRSPPRSLHPPLINLPKTVTYNVGHRIDRNRVRPPSGPPNRGRRKTPGPAGRPVVEGEGVRTVVCGVRRPVSVGESAADATCANERTRLMANRCRRTWIGRRPGAVAPILF